MYRAVQEGLTNAARYATGSPIDVNVVWDDHEVRVAVRDQGVPAAAAPPVCGAAVPVCAGWPSGSRPSGVR